MSAFQRCLILAAEVAAKTEAAAAGAVTSSAKRRGKNFFEVVADLPNWGVGSKLRRKPWSETEYYEVTKVRVKSHDGRSGSAWGLWYSSPFHPGPAEEQIRGLAKHDWKLSADTSEPVSWKEAYREPKTKPKAEFATLLNRVDMAQLGSELLADAPKVQEYWERFKGRKSYVAAVPASV